MKKHFTQFFASFLVLAICTLAHAEVWVTDVEVKPRWPWNGLVDITYSVASNETAPNVYAKLSGYDNDLKWLIPMIAVTGPGVETPVGAGGPYTLTWDVTKDTSEFHSSSFEVTISLVDTPFLYCVVDLSGGTEAASYPVRYTQAGPDLSDDTCRTTELWLRHIPAGTFLMGSPGGELGRKSNETRHQVTLTRDYYIGVFECTQRQYELVTGSSKPQGNGTTYYTGDTRPVCQASYNTLRGTSRDGVEWPTYGHTVSATSFFGKLQAKTGLTFDLPTEAQWEYACRAGTTTALNSGKNLSNANICPNMAEVGRYYYNRGDGMGGYSQHTKVGCYLPNAWGLYDMHGNVGEWCLDSYGEYGTATVTDPSGPEPSSMRVNRGGGWDGVGAYGCRSAWRGSLGTTIVSSAPGFRVALLP